MQVDNETANFLAKSDKLEKFKKEQFDKNQALVTQALANPCNLYIVCEESKMNNAELDLRNLTDDMKIRKSSFRPSDLMTSRFLKEHCWNKITEKEKSLKAEGVAVICNHDNSFEVKGTRKGTEEMTTFLDNLAKKVNAKVQTFPSYCISTLHRFIPNTKLLLLVTTHVSIQSGEAQLHSPWKI